MFCNSKYLKIMFCIFLAIFQCSFSQTTPSNRIKFLKLLGKFPSPPPLQIDTLEKVQLENGIRYKIEFTSEFEDTKFDRSIDRIKAYLFIPKHKFGEKLPAIIAIHQDGERSDIGKLEPAGIEGSSDQFYGLELFKKGYVVICPDRFPHGERRKLKNVSPQMPPMMQNISLWMRWTGQLILSGRTYLGKEVYDLMRATDVLCSLDFVAKERIGAIGHSAGGNILVYFMFVDKRIKAGVSSCGFFELLDYYNDNNKNFANAAFAIPGLAQIGKSADYLSYIAPRPLLFTRGLWEYGKENEQEKMLSEEHVSKTRNIETFVRKSYKYLNANDKLKVIYFEGGHSFPGEVRETAYKFLDNYLK